MNHTHAVELSTFPAAAARHAATRQGAGSVRLPLEVGINARGVGIGLTIGAIDADPALPALVLVLQVEVKLNESIMVTVNSVNECPYCTMLHTEVSA